MKDHYLNIFLYRIINRKNTFTGIPGKFEHGKFENPSNFKSLKVTGFFSICLYILKNGIFKTEKGKFKFFQVFLGKSIKKHTAA